MKKLATEQNQFLKMLKLADRGNKMSEVYMLISADVYWNIVRGNLKRNLETGLIAISSTLGWLVNGHPHNINMTMLHVLQVQCEKSEDKLLSENINKFWRLHLLGICCHQNSEEKRTYE